MNTTLLNRKLFFIGFLILYLELMLIRWVGSEVRIFAYLSNFVLISCFLGVGIGCFQSKKEIRPLLTFGLLLLLILCCSFPRDEMANPFKKITLLVSALEDSLVWYKGDLPTSTALIKYGSITAGIVLAAYIFLVIAYLFVPLGRKLGALLAVHPRIVTGYTWNILGSLAGGWFFALLSFWNFPPTVWFGFFAAAGGSFLFHSKTQRILGSLLSGALLLILALPYSNQEQVFWSPYHKLNLKPLWTSDHKIRYGSVLQVNNTFYQYMINLSPDFLSAYPQYFDSERAALGPYEIPYLFIRNKQRMLVVGAGSGNDCAAALRHDVERVDCVEIDPKIAELGKRYHPEKPYDDPRVRLIVEDARSFMANAKERYDIIWFGFLDSHTLASSYHNVRLDHYVYTEESFRLAKKLLRPQGVLILNFFAEKPWLTERFYRQLTTVMEERPFVLDLDGPMEYGVGVSLIAGVPNISSVIEALPPPLQTYIEQHQWRGKNSNIRIPTDDWPFLYLEKPGIPSLHLFVAAALLIVVVRMKRRIFGERTEWQWPFFFLGAGFMLLEVHTVTHMGLLWSSTWVTSQVVISQILIWILLGNYGYSKYPKLPLQAPFILLFCNLAAIYIVPLSSLMGLPAVIRIVSASVFLTLPFLFGSFIFMALFEKTKCKEDALGANLMGALAGGFLECLSFILGMRALLIVIALFYGAAFMTRRRPRDDVAGTSK